MPGKNDYASNFPTLSLYRVFIYAGGPGQAITKLTNPTIQIERGMTFGGAASTVIEIPGLP